MFHVRFADVFHTLQNQLVLTCRARGNPLPVIEWTRDDMPIKLDERIGQTETLDGICELTINQPNVGDTGVYCCTATNNIGSIEQEHEVFYPQLVLRIRTIFSHPPEDDLPELIQEKKGEESAETTAVGTDTTTTEVPPAPVVVKEKTPEPIPEPPPEPRVRYVDPRLVLNVDPDYVRRHVPRTMEEIQNAIRSKLSFATYLTNRIFAAGTRGKLSCVVQGPDPNAKWTKDDQPIVSGPLYRLTNNDGLFGLEIANCGPEHSGVYEVTVRNAECTITSSCSVQVYATKLSSDLAPTFTRNLKREYQISTIYFEFVYLRMNEK